MSLNNLLYGLPPEVEFDWLDDRLLTVRRGPLEQTTTAAS
jgi:hypothetical protein